MSIDTVVRANGSPAATQRSQKPDTISVSGVPARPACVSHPDNSAKKASFMPDYTAGKSGLALSGSSAARCLLLAQSGHGRRGNAKLLPCNVAAESHFAGRKSLL